MSILQQKQKKKQRNKKNKKFIKFTAFGVKEHFLFYLEARSMYTRTRIGADIFVHFHEHDFEDVWVSGSAWDVQNEAIVQSELEQTRLSPLFIL